MESGGRNYRKSSAVGLAFFQEHFQEHFQRDLNRFRR
jgi:hypothetical protein